MMDISATLNTVGQCNIVMKSTTYPNLILSMRLPSAPPKMNAMNTCVLFFISMNVGMTDKATTMSNVMYMTISLTPANSPNATPVFVAYVKMKNPDTIFICP